MKHLKLYERFLNEAVFNTGSKIVKANNQGWIDYEINLFKDIKEKIVKLGEDIYNVLASKGIKPQISLFHSGYRGMSIEYANKKFLVMDQPGKVGSDDQTMPYITLESNGQILKFSPDYHSRAYGFVQMDEKMRDEAYAAILDYFKKLK